MPALEDLQNFSIDEANISLWVFKGPRGSAAEDPRYSGRWVDITNEVSGVLRQSFSSDIQKIEEVQEYGLLAQNNEGSALSITVEETHGGYIVDAVAEEIPQKKVSDVKNLLNAKFYVVKFIHNDQIVLAVRKTESSWKTKKAKKIQSLFFSDEQLEVDDRPHFDLSKQFDFFIVGDEILVLNKGSFESVLRYKQAHKEDFAALTAEQEFLNVFVDVAPLREHVGENKIQLRRASAIRQKGHYRDQGFMGRLRDNQNDVGFNIQFDQNGKIIITAETCSQIMTALLDHRLSSSFSNTVYDVPSSTPVALP